ncbi:MAG TPA: hypothetical protein VHQ24_12190, partial [Lachnospiraceae bacterium]|nr:hypothetical protein [Lachnospiraceae bacterium]
MESITYYELKTNIESIQRIEKFRVIQTVNEHAYLYLSAVLDSKYKDEYVKRNTEDKVIEVYAENEDGTKTILFKGMVRSEEARRIQDIYYLELEGISFSFLTDIKRKSRSYQDTTLTYKEAFKTIMEDYSDWDIQDTASKGANLSRLYVQYEETDWQFLKRLASQFHKGVLPSIT